VELLAGLRAALESLRDAGCLRAYVDGSFVTAKEEPGDFDACWEPAGVDPDLLDPLLMNMTPAGRVAQKARFGGELFVASASATPAGMRFLEFFQQDRDGNPKGVVAIDLGAMT
jgi:hypothetical protein